MQGNDVRKQFRGCKRFDYVVEVHLPAGQQLKRRAGLKHIHDF